MCVHSIFHFMVKFIDALISSRRCICRCGTANVFGRLSVFCTAGAYFSLWRRWLCRPAWSTWRAVAAIAANMSHVDTFNSIHIKTDCAIDSSCCRCNKQMRAELQKRGRQWSIKLMIGCLWCAKIMLFLVQVCLFIDCESFKFWGDFQISDISGCDVLRFLNFNFEKSNFCQFFRVLQDRHNFKDTHY